jgi:hypothetical protein
MYFINYLKGILEMCSSQDVQKEINKCFAESNAVALEEKQLWINIYLLEKHDDPHAVFAEHLGVNRVEAKRRCYILMYSFRFLAQIMEATQR